LERERGQELSPKRLLTRHWQVRTARPEVSRDSDVFFSSLGLLCGGILVFQARSRGPRSAARLRGFALCHLSLSHAQGWRLDPILFFGQLLTAATAVSFAVETLRLRGEVEEARAAAEEGAPRRRRAARNLPPAGAAPRYGAWSGAVRAGRRDRAADEAGEAAAAEEAGEDWPVEEAAAGSDDFRDAFEAARRGAGAGAGAAPRKGGADGGWGSSRGGESDWDDIAGRPPLK